MAIVRPIDPNQIVQYEKWVASLPKDVQRVVNRWPPTKLYRYDLSDGKFQRVTIESYSEDGTVTMGVWGKYNFVTHERRVFGIDPNRLTECDLPSSDELVGNMDMSVEELKILMEKRK